MTDATTRKRPGRVRLSVRVHPTERDAFTLIARSEGRSVSNAARELIRARIRESAAVVEGVHDGHA